MGCPVQQSTFTPRPLMPVRKQHSCFVHQSSFPLADYLHQQVEPDLPQFVPSPYFSSQKSWWRANIKKPTKTDGSGGFCNGQPKRRESLNSSKTLLTCPKQNIWQPWKSRPAKGRSCFIPHSSQQNRAHASRTWLSKKDEFLKRVGSFCRLLPLNHKFAVVQALLHFQTGDQEVPPRFGPRCINPPTASTAIGDVHQWSCEQDRASRFVKGGSGKFPFLKRARIGQGRVGIVISFFSFYIF